MNHRLRFGAAIVVATTTAIAIALPWLVANHLLLLTHILITGLFALSLDLILGVAGLVSLGHAAFFGIGAYAAGLLSKHLTPDPVIGLVLASAIAGLAGLLSSPLVVRGSDLSRLMVTLGFSLLLYEAANRAGGLTGGADGLQGIVMGPVLGLWTFDMLGRTGYLYVLAVVLLVVLLTRVVLGSELGVSLRAIHDQARRATAMGINVPARLSGIYFLAAALAGTAGALMAHTTQFVGLDIFSFAKSAEILVILIVGGVGLRWGGFAGAAVYLVAHEKLSAVAPQYWNFWLGLLLILLVLFVPNGVLGGLSALRQRFATLDQGRPE
ncbi:MAG TPA: branched-chain amino acid ABC transporter permease [Burkholderiaceae bacterium]|nr:branched-chain amino acid ABC transporter permease [Burkholderiaceae bacterium]